MSTKDSHKNINDSPFNVQSHVMFYLGTSFATAARQGAVIFILGPGPVMKSITIDRELRSLE